MPATTNFLAADLGASNGRALGPLGRRASPCKNCIASPTARPPSMTGFIGTCWGCGASYRRGWRYAAQYDEPPAGIGVDTWGVDFGLLDRAGRLMGNPVAYRDARTNGIMDVACAVVPAETIFDITGIQFMQFNTLFQLYAMRHGGDPQLDAAETLLMLPDLFHYWLTGRKAAEYTIASTSQMFDARERRWAAGLMAKLDLPTRILPQVVPPGTVLGEVLPGVLDAAGLQGPVPVIAPGGHDTASAVAAVPGLDARSLYISSGTWSLMGMEIAEPIINERTRSLNFTNEGGVDNTIRLLKNIAGLWTLQESRRQWRREGQDFSWNDLTSQAEQAEPFSSLIDPDAADFLNPSNMVDAIRDYCRRTDQPVPETVGQVVRCCLESLALRYRWVLNALEEIAGTQIETMRIVGGGSQNRLLSQLAADACRRPVITGPVEATALGNVMLQAIAAGRLSSIAEGREAIAASIEQETFEPGSAAGWDDAFGRYEALLARE